MKFHYSQRACVNSLPRDSLCCVLLLLVLLAGEATAETRGPKVVILEFHGMKRNILAANLEQLPNFRELIRGSNDDQPYVYLPRVLTTIPAASQPAVTAMYTGIYPQRTGVVSTIWFDRRTAKVHTLISLSQQRTNRILTARQVKTLFDYVGGAGKRSMTTMLMLTNGADWSVKSSAFFWGNASVLGAVRNGKWVPDSRYVDRNTLSGFLRGRVLSYWKSLAGVFKSRHLIPDVMAVQLLGMDLFSHYPSSDLRNRAASIEEVQYHYARLVLDPLMGRLTTALKEIGFYQDTIFVLVSEHGFTRIRDYIPDDTLNRSLRNSFSMPGWNRSERQAEAVVMPGAATKEVYIKNRASGEWLDPPRILADVKPAVGLILANQDVQDSLDSLLIRQYPERHEGLPENDHWWVFDWRAYRQSGGDDPAFLAALRPLDELVEHFELGDYVVQGLRRQYTEGTAPDIKLITKQGHYFLRDVDKYAHHGSYFPEDCIVSFWVVGPGLSRIIPGRHTLEHTSSTLDLVPMVTYLLGIPMPDGLDGDNPLAKLAPDF